MEELDFFLLYLKERKEDQFEEYVQALEKTLKGCIKKVDFDLQMIHAFNKQGPLAHYHTLYQAAFGAFLSICNYDSYGNPDLKKEMEFYKRDLLRGKLFLKYYAAVSLKAIMSKCISRTKVATHDGGKWPVISVQSGHL